MNRRRSSSSRPTASGAGSTCLGITIGATGAAASSAAASPAVHSYNASTSTCASTSSAGSSSIRGKYGAGAGSACSDIAEASGTASSAIIDLFFNFGVGDSLIRK